VSVEKNKARRINRIRATAGCALLLAATAQLSAQNAPNLAPAPPPKPAGSAATVAAGVPTQIWSRGVGGNHFDGPKDIVYPPTLAPEDTRLNMYFGDWHNSQPKAMYGSLVVRDILTPGDNLSPPFPGQVLERAKFLSYGTLGAGERTTPTTLQGMQLFLYVEEGTGEITGDGKTTPLHRGNAILIPENHEFALHTTSDSQMSVYMVGDPVKPGFKPLPGITVRDEATLPHGAPSTPSPFTSPGAGGHWAHITHSFFSSKELSTVQGIITVDIAPLTLGEPHPHLPGKEEIWCQIEGDSVAFVGPQVRMQHPGQAYILRPDGLTTHSNINIDPPGTKPVKFLWFNTNTGLAAAPH
jgi:mannose-6-phosphate isomerase-like protein (cupin superfamily)